MDAVFGGGAGVGALINESFNRQEIIEHGAAHYDSVTGEWQWNEEESDANETESARLGDSDQR